VTNFWLSVAGGKFVKEASWRKGGLLLVSDASSAVGCQEAQQEFRRREEVENCGWSQCTRGEMESHPIRLQFEFSCTIRWRRCSGMKKFAIWRKEGSGVGEQMRCAGV